MLEWMDMKVVLLGYIGVLIVEDICCNTHPHDCVEECSLHNEDVSVGNLELFVNSKCIPLNVFYYVVVHTRMPNLR